MASEIKEGKTAGLIFEAIGMKKLLRTGWLCAGAQNESLASHSFGAAVIALALAKMEGLSEKDEAALVKRVLLHDLHEARTGDLSRLYRDYVSADFKRAERDMLTGTHLEGELANLQGERLSLLTKDADKLDLLFQAVHNANAGNKNMGAFIEFALGEVKSKSGRKLAKMAFGEVKK